MKRRLALVAGEERQNVTGSLCRLCRDGPPAPREAFHQPPLVLSASWRSCQKGKAQLQVVCITSLTNYTVVVWGGWFSGSLLKDQRSFFNTLQSMAQLCSLANRCANLQCHVCDIPPIFSSLWKMRNLCIFLIKIITMLFSEVWNFFLQMYNVQIFKCTVLQSEKSSLNVLIIVNYNPGSNYPVINNIIVRGVSCRPKPKIIQL